MMKAVVNMAPPGATLLPPAPPAPGRGLPAYTCRATGERLILVIEGSPTIQKIIELTLGREGYEVCCFRDGIDAMRWLAGPQAHLPDLLLVDLDLPKLDGYRVIQKLKAKPCLAHTTCLVLCEHKTPSRVELEQMDVAGSLRKPFTIQELVMAVQTSRGSVLALEV
jgi:DNA-binding response OmpR family regulator